MGLPIFSNDALHKLGMPVLAIVGARGVLLNSKETKRRLESYASKAEVVYLPEGGHFIPGQTKRIVAFLAQ